VSQLSYAVLPVLILNKEDSQRDYLAAAVLAPEFSIALICRQNVVNHRDALAKLGRSKSTDNSSFR